jgi:hypothetical protein
MLLLLLCFEGVAFFDYVKIRYAPVMGKMNLLAPADNVCRRKNGILDHGL